MQTLKAELGRIKCETKSYSVTCVLTMMYYFLCAITSWLICTVTVVHIANTFDNTLRYCVLYSSIQLTAVQDRTAAIKRFRIFETRDELQTFSYKTYKAELYIAGY